MKIGRRGEHFLNLQFLKNRMIMPAKSYAEYIKDAEVMSSGLSNNVEQAATRGMNAEFTGKLKSNLSEAVQLNNEQEKLKADLKTKTAALDAVMKSMNAQVSKARKLVKIEFPQAQWKEFGIDAKR
jgi:hypothetical protein